MKHFPIKLPLMTLSHTEEYTEFSFQILQTTFHSAPQPLQTEQGAQNIE